MIEVLMDLTLQLMNKLEVLVECTAATGIPQGGVLGPLLESQIIQIFLLCRR